MQDFAKEARRMRAILDIHRWLESTVIDLGLPAQAHVSLEDRAVYLRVFDYCAVVTRLYSAYEAYVFRLADSWLAALSKANFQGITREELEHLRSGYRAGLSYLLRRLSEPRFKELSERTLLTSALAFVDPDVPKEKLLLDPFTAELNNLRFEELQNIFNQLELKGLESWLHSHPSFTSSGKFGAESIKSRLRDFVKRRNEVSHGNRVPEEILGATSLVELLEFFEELASALWCFVVAKLIKVGALLHIGTVTQVFVKPKAFLLDSSGEMLDVGRQVLVLSSGSHFIDHVDSIQLEGQPFHGVTPGSGTVLGLRLVEGLPQRSASLYRVMKPEVFGSLSDI